MKAFWCISYISYILFCPLNVHSSVDDTYVKIETFGYGFIKETLDITCTITSTAIQKNASDIIFTFNNTEKNNTSILGEKSKKLTLPLDDPSMNGSNVSCQVYNPTHIDSKIIYVEYAPQNITDIFCVNHEWDLSLNCSWRHPVEYLNWDNIQVTSGWSSEFSLETIQKCSESNINYCNLTEGRFFSGKLIIISVEVKNTRMNVSITGRFEFEADTIVKPPPLRTVDYEIWNSTCIILKWTDERPYRNKYVNVIFESEWKDPKENVTYEVEDSSDVNRAVCELFPYTSYTFTFTVYPEDSGYASEATNIITNKTWSSEPLYSPKTTEGALYYKTQECQLGKLRNVTIFWQPLEKKHWSGDPRGVSIQYSKIGGLETTNTKVSGDDLSHTIELDCNLTYSINITAENDAGQSSNYSSLCIPQYEPDFQPPGTKVEVPKEGNTNLVYVSWNVAAKLDQSKVEATVFWCKKSRESFCEGQVYWKKNISVTSTDLITADSPDQYKFGVSLETYTENTDDKRRSTGLQWEECIYVKDKKPEISPKLKMIKTSEDKTLSVRWTRLACPSGSPFIIKYTIYYCKTQEKEKCKGTTNHKDMHPEEDFLKLDNLEAEQEYGFWVTASSDLGEGPKSDWVYSTPVDNNMTGGEIVGTVIAGLFVLVLAAAGAVFSIRHVKRKSFKIPPIEVPETSPVYFNQAMDDKDDKDDAEKEDIIDSLPSGSIKLKYANKCKRQQSQDSGIADTCCEECRSRNSSSSEEEEEVEKKENKQETRRPVLPLGYIRVGSFNPVNELNLVPETETTVAFVAVEQPVSVEKIQNPMRGKTPEPMKKDADHEGDLDSFFTDMKPAINSYVKCNCNFEPSPPDRQHPVNESNDNNKGVINLKLSAVSAVSDCVQSDSNVKSSPEKSKLNGKGQLKAFDYIPGVSHPQPTLAIQSQPTVSNYVSNVTNPESMQAVSNNKGQSSVSNCFTGIKTPQTVSEGESFVSDYVSQPHQMLADRSTKGQPAVNGYVSNVMNFRPLSGNSNSESEPAVIAYLTNGTCPQPESTNRSTQGQSSVTGYVTSATNSQLPPPNNEPQLQPAVNDHVFNTQSMSASSNNHCQPAVSNYVHTATNPEPAELNDEYQAKQDNYIRGTIIMQQVSVDVRSHDQTPVDNYVTSVTNPQSDSRQTNPGPDSC